MDPELYAARTQTKFHTSQRAARSPVLGDGIFSQVRFKVGRWLVVLCLPNLFRRHAARHVNAWAVRVSLP